MSRVEALLAWVRPPVLDDPEESTRAAVVWFCAMCGVANVLVQAVLYTLTPSLGRLDSLPYLLLQLVGFSLVLLGVRRGRVRGPAGGLIATMVVLITAFVFFGGGLRYSFPPLLGTAAVMGSLMLGWRVGALLTAWAALVTVAVYFTGATEHLLTRDQEFDDVLLSIQLVTVLFSGSLVTFSTYRLGLALRAERAQAEAASEVAQQLGQARRFTADVVQSMGEAVLIVQQDGGVLDANDAAVRMFGAGTSEQIVGDPIETLVRASDLATLEATATSGNRAFGEAVVSVGGVERAIRMARSPVKGEDGEDLFVFVLSDVSEQVEARRRSEEAARAAEEANLAKSRFLANMSHELRTPLNAVIGYSDMLIDDLDDRDARQDVERIRYAGKHLLDLINDVLDMSKIEAGRLDVVLEPVFLSSVLDEITDVVMPLAQRRRNQVEIDRQTDLPALMTDARKFRQILLNLVSNAVKFTEDGRVTIRVRSDVESIVFDVEDTGIGIRGDVIERLFQPFVQADDSTSRKYGGTGLGLALSRRLAEMLGGELSVVSTPGQGSTFTLTHPLGAEVLETPAPEVDDGAAPLVLCVDDDAPTLELLGRILRRQGLRVAQAQTGTDALKIAREHRPRVITLDVMMPEMDGWSLLQRLRADPLLRDVPVVMVSMVDHSEAHALSLGASDYLVKPVEADTLFRTLQRYLTRGTGTVMVVDDEPDIRELLRRLLTGEGWEVVQAPNSRIALERLPEARPDLVILDLMMPEMDGFAFVERVRDDDRFRDMPIVVLTAMDLDREQWDMLTAHTAQIVQKGGTGLQRVLESVRRFART